MRTFIITLLLLFSVQAQAFDNYLSNIFSPIPPGCVTQQQLLQALNYSGTETLLTGSIGVTGLDGGEEVLNLTVWRIGCAVDSRSALFVDFEIDAELSEGGGCGYIPRVGAMVADGTLRDFRLTDEPNSWIDRDEFTVICAGSPMRFFVETLTSLSGDFEQDRLMDAFEYNDDFTIRFEDILGVVSTAEIVAYENDLGESEQAISGRLSGNWGTAGASDQGFLISFNELSGPDNMAFISWYTFDQNGNQLWLVGNAVYEVGDTSIDVNLEVVSGGSFLGAKTVTRTAAGNIFLLVRSCNEIEADYNLSNIGLGQGSETLVRIVSLEIAGYACADPITRIIHETDF